MGQKINNFVDTSVQNTDLNMIIDVINIEVINISKEDGKREQQATKQYLIYKTSLNLKKEKHVISRVFAEH